MTYLLTQLYVWMAVACILGFAAGWLICSRRWSRKLEEQRERYRQHMARLEMDLRRGDDNSGPRDTVAPSADPSSFLAGDETDQNGFSAAALKATDSPSISTNVDKTDADKAHRPPEVETKVVAPAATSQTAAALPVATLKTAEPEITNNPPANAEPIWASRVANCEKDIAVLQKQLAALDKRCKTPAPKKPVAKPATVAATTPTMKAYGLTGPEGEADDLKRIWGVGPKLESMLNDLGIYHFAQIANFTDKDVADVSDRLDQFADRITRDNWIDQARKLIS